MDAFAFLRMMGSLAVVLGLLAGALYLVRRYELRLPQNWLAGLTGTSSLRRMELVERLAIDTRRSVALIRVDGLEHTVLITPEGVVALGQKAALENPAAVPQNAIAEAKPAEKPAPKPHTLQPANSQAPALKGAA